MARWPAVGVVVAALVLLVLSVMVAAGAPLVATVDGALERGAYGLRSAALTTVAATLTVLGSAVVLVPLTALVAVVGRVVARTWRPGAVVALAGAGSYVSMELLKQVLQRPRPTDQLVGAAGWSFPSGHSTDAAAWWLTAAAAALWVGGARWVRWQRALVGVAAVLVAVVVGVTRVYLGVHHPTDVLAGWSLGIVWAWLIVVTLLGRSVEPPVRAP